MFLEKLEIAAHNPDTIWDWEGPRSLTELWTFFEPCNAYFDSHRVSLIWPAHPTKGSIEISQGHLKLLPMQNDSHWIQRKKSDFPRFSCVLVPNGWHTVNTDACSCQVGSVLLHKKLEGRQKKLYMSQDRSHKLNVCTLRPSTNACPLYSVSCSCVLTSKELDSPSARIIQP